MRRAPGGLRYFRPPPGDIRKLDPDASSPVHQEPRALLLASPIILSQTSKADGLGRHRKVGSRRRVRRWSDWRRVDTKVHRLDERRSGGVSIISHHFAPASAAVARDARRIWLALCAGLVPLIPVPWALIC
jgi:hypothetical protein